MTQKGKGPPESNRYLPTELQERILDALAKNPVATRAELARILDLSLSSINHAVPGLLKEDVVLDGLILHPEWNPLSKFYIFIETKPVDMNDENYQWKLISTIRSRLKDSSTIVFEAVDIVIGADWDIILSVRAPDPQLVYRFVVSALRPLPTVSRTRTASVLKSKESIGEMPNRFI